MITGEIIQQLAQQALSQVSSSVSAHNLEATVIRVQLNGYTTSEPIGKRAAQVVVSILQSDIDLTIKNGIEHAISSALTGRALSMHSLTRIVLSVMHRHITGSPNYVVIRVGNDATSCVVIRKDEIVDQKTIPGGLAAMARLFAGSEGLPEEIASVMLMIASDSCSTPGCEAAKANIAKAEPELVRLFGEGLTALSTQRRLPNRCFISIDEHFAPWFMRFMEKIDFAQFTATSHPFSVERLQAKSVAEAVVWQPGIREETGLALTAAFVNTR